MKTTILKTELNGLTEIVEFMYYEGVEDAKLNDGRTIEVYGNGTYEIY